MRISLRVKLALVSLLLLFIPLTGFRFSELIKQDLLESRRETMLFSARAVASALSGRTGLFDRELFHSLNADRDLYLYQLSNPMRLNGKTDDWQPHLEEALVFGEEHRFFRPNRTTTNHCITGILPEFGGTISTPFFWLPTIK
jgi:hypothetical protein